jgi:hypothetical protein
VTIHKGTATLTAAQNAAALAMAEAVRAEHIAELLAQPGLTYGDLGDGTNYVSYNGEHIGDCRHEGSDSSALLNWFAYPLDGAPAMGPFGTARQGAAALMRRQLDTSAIEPNTPTESGAADSVDS